MCKSESDGSTCRLSDGQQRRLELLWSPRASRIEIREMIEMKNQAMLSKLTCDDSAELWQASGSDRSFAVM